VKPIDDFATTIAHRIARFPAAGQAVVKDRVNAVALPPVEGIEIPISLPKACAILRLKRGFQSRDGETMPMMREMNREAPYGAQNWTKVLAIPILSTGF
jgi:hypothetical protein